MTEPTEDLAEDLDLTQHRERFVEHLELRDDDEGRHYIRGVVAPYNSPTDIGGQYIETFVPGLFKKSVGERGNRITLTEMHKRDSFPIGNATSWDETSDGLIAEFRLNRTAAAQAAAILVLDGDIGGLSVGFAPIRNRVTNKDGVRHVERVEAILDHVGLVHSPAYDGARVLAARDADAGPFDPDSFLHAPKLARYRALLGKRL